MALYVLPFDHRGSFHRMLFPGVTELTQEQHQIIKDRKQTIFNAAKMIGEKRGFENIAILGDEQYCTEIHQQAKELGITTILTTEKSGQEIYDFEYENWQEHILKIAPDYCKALTRVVTGKDYSLQNERLKMLGDFCTENNIGFLIEPLIQPNDEDLASVDGDKERFDAEVRPTRFAEAVAEMHAAGVKPDVWKIEGTESKEGMDICSNAAYSGGKENVQIVILGRGATQEKVDYWLHQGAHSKGVTGFAVGRTIFAEPIEQLHKGEISEEEATQKVADGYDHCIEVFEAA
ncbi:MAG: DUF2090 domain-containing protein [Candidatus Gracilibacteria bacterium]|nr:DUF2090 domain-containing protein [Candidatus Gracilibacteria bacterium]